MTTANARTVILHSTPAEENYRATCRDLCDQVYRVMGASIGKLSLRLGDVVQVLERNPDPASLVMRVTTPDIDHLLAQRDERFVGLMLAEDIPEMLLISVPTGEQVLVKVVSNLDKQDEEEE